jgi:hypothetical protein
VSGGALAWKLHCLGKIKTKAHAIIWGNSLPEECRMHNYDENLNCQQFLAGCVVINGFEKSNLLLYTDFRTR